MIKSRLRCDVPRQQVVNSVDRMIGDAGEDIAKIGFRIEAVELRGLDERQNGGGALAVLVRSGEQPVDNQL